MKETGSITGIIIRCLEYAKGNAVFRANLHAFPAVGTLGRINGSMKIFHFDRIRLTGLHAFHAANTAHRTSLAGNYAFVSVLTGNDCLIPDWDHIDQVSGAGLHAHGACHA